MPRGAAVQDPYRLEAYLAHNSFLADINNERLAKNATYRENLASLDKLVLFRFKDDVTVVPRDSAWFAFYNGSRLLRMEETALYQVCGRALPDLARHLHVLHAHLACASLPVVRLHAACCWPSPGSTACECGGYV